MVQIPLRQKPADEANNFRVLVNLQHFPALTLIARPKSIRIYWQRQTAEHGRLLTKEAAQDLQVGGAVGNKDIAGFKVSKVFAQKFLLQYGGPV
jgi:hypothetical protein